MSCIMCKSANTTIIERIKAIDLIYLYKKINIDISNQFKNIDYINVIKCNKCGLLFFDPQITGCESFYEELQRYPWYYMEDKYEYSFASKYVKNSDTVLEIGSGKGEFAKYLNKNNYMGLEFNQKAIDTAKSNGIELRKQSIQEFATENMKFDVVCCFQVLEHISDVNEFIEACVTCIKPGGLFIIAVPSQESFISKIENYTLDLPPHHISRWTDNCLRNLSNIFGLELVDLHHEPLQDVHKNLFLDTYIKSKIIKRTKVVNDSSTLKILNMISVLIRKLSGARFEGELKNQIGQTVVTVYKKN